MADDIAIPSIFNYAVSRTTIAVEVVTIITLVVDQQTIATDLVAFPIIVQRVACYIITPFALFATQKVGVLAEQCLSYVAVDAMRVQCVTSNASFVCIQILTV